MSVKLKPIYTAATLERWLSDPSMVKTMGREKEKLLRQELKRLRANAEQNKLPDVFPSDVCPASASWALD